MTGSRRTFTLAEANALLPRMTLLVTRLQALGRRLEAERRAAAATHAPDDPAGLARDRPAVRLVVEELDAVVQDIEADGAQLKDVALGLVDFPGELAGEPVLLCWQLGEPEIAFVHGVHEGFAGRRPLPGANPGRWLQ